MKFEVIDKFAALITAAFGLVAALAWNSAIQKWFESQPYVADTGPWVYASAVTILAVLLTLWIGKVADKAKKVELHKRKGALFPHLLKDEAAKNMRKKK